MTDNVRPISSGLPSMLTAEEAAEYVHAKSADQFRREVKAGIWPAPFAKKSRPQRWLRSELDRILFPRSEKAQNLDEELERRIDRELGLI